MEFPYITSWRCLTKNKRDFQTAVPWENLIFYFLFVMLQSNVVIVWAENNSLSYRCRKFFHRKTHSKNLLKTHITFIWGKKIFVKIMTFPVFSILYRSVPYTKLRKHNMNTENFVAILWAYICGYAKNFKWTKLYIGSNICGHHIYGGVIARFYCRKNSFLFGNSGF